MIIDVNFFLWELSWKSSFIKARCVWTSLMWEYSLRYILQALFFMFIEGLIRSRRKKVLDFPVARIITIYGKDKFHTLYPSRDFNYFSHEIMKVSINWWDLRWKQDSTLLCQNSFGDSELSRTTRRSEGTQSDWKCFGTRSYRMVLWQGEKLNPLGFSLSRNFETFETTTSFSITLHLCCRFVDIQSYSCFSLFLSPSCCLTLAKSSPRIQTTAEHWEDTIKSFELLLDHRENRPYPLPPVHLNNPSETRPRAALWGLNLTRKSRRSLGAGI